jgi:hypothetical protein
MARTLSDDDVEAIATRVAHVLGMRLIAAMQPREAAPPVVPPHEPVKPLKQKLAFSLAELSAELGVSKVSVYRLEARGLIRSLPYLRTKIYSHAEVEKFLRGRGGEPLK